MRAREAEVTSAPLDVAYVSAVEAGLFGQRFLRQIDFFSSLSDVATESHLGRLRSRHIAYSTPLWTLSLWTLSDIRCLGNCMTSPTGYQNRASAGLGVVGGGGNFVGGFSLLSQHPLLTR